MKATPVPGPKPMPTPSEELLLDADSVGLTVEVDKVAAPVVEEDIVVTLVGFGLAVVLGWPIVAAMEKRSLRAQQASGVIGPQHHLPSTLHRVTTVLGDIFPVCHISAKYFSIRKMID